MTKRYKLQVFVTDVTNPAATPVMRASLTLEGSIATLAMTGYSFLDSVRDVEEQERPQSGVKAAPVPIPHLVDEEGE